MKRLDWNKNWQFFRQDCPEQVRTLDLPHDAMLEEPRCQENPSQSAGAYFAGGRYHYEKTFAWSPDWAGKEIWLQLEGVYQTAEVTVNGREAARVTNGYTTTEVCITSLLREGENTLCVEADNSRQPNSRWYTGAGLYRPVWLWVLEPGGLPLHGVKVTTLGLDPARVEVTVAHQRGQARVEILDGQTVVAAGRGDRVELTVSDARLWSAGQPNLYRCRVTLEEDGAVLDRQEVTFGLRMLSWSAEGFFVNGQRTLLKGGCLHHDNGLLGACAYEEAEWRRVRIMKEAGFNAIRSAHNPCSRAMLEACDALGMYVMDESWDMWYRHKNKYDYAEFFPEHWQEDLTTLVERDYNHPGVVLYSIGNEVSEPASEQGLAQEKAMVELLHRLDPTRPVTGGFNLTILANAAKGQLLYNEEGGLNQDNAGSMAGEQDAPAPQPPKEMNSTLFNQMIQQVGTGMNHAADSDEADRAISPALDLLDIAGYNYASGRYPLEGEKHPDRVILGSETFPHEIYQNWQMVRQYPYLVGDFMWTAWDYLGEAGLGGWSCRPDAMAFNKPCPWLLGGAGVISILGDPDGEALYARVVWEEDAPPALAVRPVNQPQDQLIKSIWRGTNAIPRWSWRGCEGQKTIAEVYARGARAELLLNGRSLGTQPLEAYKALFEVTYQPGTLEAVIYDADGAVLGRTALHSAEGAIRTVLTPEETPRTGGLVYLNIDRRGENGVVDGNQDVTLSVEVEGGRLLGFGSANPCTGESYLSGRFTTWQGRSQAVIRAGEGGTLTVRVREGEHTEEINWPLST